MKRQVIKAVVICLGLLCFLIICILLIVGYFLSWDLEYMEYGKAVSPDDKHIAKVYLRSQGADPPYGRSVSVWHSWWPLGEYYATTVFSGYCVENTPVIEWKDSEQLIIKCVEPKEVSIRLEEYDGVVIDYQMLTSP